MPLEQRSLILKISTSHHTHTPNTQCSLCTGRPNSLTAITAKLLLFSPSLHNFQSTFISSCVFVSEPAEETGNALSLFKARTIPGRPWNFSYSTMPNIYQKSLPDTCDQVMQKQLLKTKHRHFMCKAHPKPISYAGLSSKTITRRLKFTQSKSHFFPFNLHWLAMME